MGRKVHTKIQNWARINFLRRYRLNYDIIISIHFIKGKTRYDPMKKSKMNDCRICKMTLHQKGAHFCSTCAYQKGICMMCGKKVQSTLGAKMSLT